MPDSRRTFGPRASLSSSTPATLSRIRNVTFVRRSRYWNASPISLSRNGSTRSRLSTTVTFVPSAPNIDAYSTPITPAPTTVIVRGTRCSSLSRPSESMTVRSSNSTDAGRAGRVPPAMMIRRGADRLVGVLDPHRVRVLEAGLAGQQSDAVAAELLAHDRRLGRHDARRAVHQLLERVLLGLLDAGRVEHVERALGELLQHRLAQGLGGDRPGVDRDAAEALAALGHRHPLAELGGLDGGLLTAGPGTDDEKVELHRPAHRTL